MTKVIYTKLFAMLQDKVKGWLDKLLFGFRSWFRDMYYYPLTLEELKMAIDFWVNDILPILEYSSEVFDCDDFGSLFKGLINFITDKNGVGEAIGEVVLPTGETGLHEWNVVLVEFPNGDQVVLYIEPQTGEVFKEISQEGWLYKLKYVLY